MPLPDNKQLNSEFVQIVEEYPELYNYNLRLCSNRNEQDKVWRAVAARFQEAGRYYHRRHLLRNLLLQTTDRNNIAYSPLEDILTNALLASSTVFATSSV